MIFSGAAMVLVGVWLTLQAIGGNLAGRIRGWATGAGGSGSPSSTAARPARNTGPGNIGSEAEQVLELVREAQRAAEAARPPMPGDIGLGGPLNTTRP